MTRKDNMPLMVYAALLGIRHRRAAMACVWLCIAIAAAALLTTAVLVIRSDWAMSLLPFFSGIGFIAITGWYWYAIRWVDRHSSWK